MRMANKVALITGAGSGLGEAMARRLAQEGALVVASDIDFTAVQGVVASIVVEPSFDSTICLGQTVTFTATATNGGDSPSFEWLVNGQAAGSVAATFTTDQLNDQDVVACSLNSTVACLEMNPVLSNSIVVSVDSCASATEFESTEADDYQVYPNPTSGKISVEFFKPKANFVAKILNNQGQRALQTLENHTNLTHKLVFDLSSFPKGVYFLQIISSTQTSVQKLVLH